MARVELRKAWRVDGDIEHIRQALRRFVASCKMRIVNDAGDELELKQGSQFLTRLLGGWFVSAKRLPKRARIVLYDADDGVRIEASIEEAMGFGFLDPILKNKYQDFFAEWMRDLRAVTLGRPDR